MPVPCRTAPQSRHGRLPTRETAPQSRQGRLPTRRTTPQSRHGRLPTRGTTPQSGVGGWALVKERGHLGPSVEASGIRMIPLLFEAAQGCRALGERSLGIRVSHRPHHVPGPPRGPVTVDALPQGRSDDGTALRFVLRRGAWVARFPGESSMPKAATRLIHLNADASTGRSWWRQSNVLLASWHESKTHLLPNRRLDGSLCDEPPS